MSTKFHPALSLACVGSLLLAACGKESAPDAAPAQVPYVAAVPAAPPANSPVAPAASDVLARRMLEGWIGAWNAHDPARASALLADDVEYFDAGFYGIQHGREAAMDRGFEVFLRGVPDLKFEVRGEPVVSKDAVAWEWTFTGTHTGTWGFIAPTNQKITLKGFSLMRLRDGKIVQLSSYYDTATLNRQLGL
jgi:steroid delta-isomerase-like uncharacterized protein